MSEIYPETAPASLILVGAPPIEELESYGLENLQALVLVEPDPMRAAQLSKHFEARKEVTVVNGAVGNTSGTAELCEFNFPGLRSICQPAPALRRLLPGIRVRKKCMVDVVTSELLLKQVGDLPPPIHLHINLLGSEHEILEGWYENERLDQLVLIRVRCSAEPMFEEGPAGCVVTEWMSKHSFIATIDRTDPDWPNIEFRKNPLAQRLREAESREAGQSAELAQIRSQVAALDNEVADLRRQLAVREERIVELEAGVQAAHGEARRSKEALAAAQSDLSVVARMQMIAQLDLRELQARFVATEQTRIAQEDLLKKLTPRLQEASQQLQMLASPRGEDADVDS